MKIVGLCSFYDESPTWLAACVTGAARVCDHLVFVDGAYFLYDKNGSSSGVESHDAIARACHAAGVGYTLHVPDTCWMGNEVEKRAFMFQLAEQLTTEDDFYFVFDADVIVTKVSGVREDLAASDRNSFSIRVFERNDRHQGDTVGAPDAEFDFACIFRAKRGLTVKGAHYVYVYPDDEALNGWSALWGPQSHFDVEAPTALQLTVEHWSKFRAKERYDAAWDYYRLRDNVNAERLSETFVEGVAGDAVRVGG